MPKKSCVEKLEATRARASQLAAGSGVQRKVLRREDFGVCVLLPKTLWPRFPAAGAARAIIDHSEQQVTVCVEQCNCRGTGWHEHRFLALPPAAAAAKGTRITLEVP